MSTMVSFHAHPDDEALLCGGTPALAAQAGHRTVLVTATNGEHGSVGDEVLDPEQGLTQRRRAELADSARILGIARSISLGYRDSGMPGRRIDSGRPRSCTAGRSAGSKR